MPTKITTITVNELGLASAANAAAQAAAASAADAEASAQAAQAAENSLLEWRGPWATGQSYAPSDIVHEAGSAYICIVAHTSGTFSTDLTNNLWQLFAAEGSSGPGSGDLLSSNNLSDLANAATARANLGLGNIATRAFLDEDDMASDSAVAAPSQQSVKAYVDAEVAAAVPFTFVAMAQMDANAGSPTLSGNSGFASVTRNAAGDFTFTFDAVEPDTNYVVQATALNTGLGISNRFFVGVQDLTTSGFDIHVVNINGSAIDVDLMVSVWRA